MGARGVYDVLFIVYPLKCKLGIVDPAKIEGCRMCFTSFSASLLYLACKNITNKAMVGAYSPRKVRYYEKYNKYKQ